MLLAIEHSSNYKTQPSKARARGGQFTVLLAGASVTQWSRSGLEFGYCFGVMQK
jgi:hypothetical protein